MFRIMILSNSFRTGMEEVQDRGLGIPDRCVFSEGFWEICYL